MADIPLDLPGPASWMRGGDWRGTLRTAARPSLGAVTAGIVLLPLAEPVALRLAPAPALCLLTGLGWLVYLAIRGDAGPPRAAPTSRADEVLREIARS